MQIEAETDSVWDEPSPFLNITQGTLIQEITSEAKGASVQQSLLILGATTSPLQFYAITKIKDKEELSIADLTKGFFRNCSSSSSVISSTLTIDELLCCNFELVRLWFTGLVKGEYEKSDLEQWFKTRFEEQKRLSSLGVPSKECLRELLKQIPDKNNYHLFKRNLEGNHLFKRNLEGFNKYLEMKDIRPYDLEDIFV